MESRLTHRQRILDQLRVLRSEPPSFGARLEILRHERGYSQAQLGEAVGVSQARICGWERRGGWPKPIQLLKLAKALDVRIETLCLPVTRSAPKKDATDIEKPSGPNPLAS